MSTITSAPVTEEEFVRTLNGETDTLYEVVDGQIVELEPMGAFETALAFRLGYFLQCFVDGRNIGIVVTETLFTLDEQLRLRRRPDAAYVSYERWPEAEVPHANAWNVVPDLAVEVVSPTNTDEEIDEKIVDYFAAGVRRLWVVYPSTGRVYVCTSANHITVLERNESLTGGDVLPGFELPIEKLFAGMSKPNTP